MISGLKSCKAPWVTMSHKKHKKDDPSQKVRLFNLLDLYCLYSIQCKLPEARSSIVRKAVFQHIYIHLFSVAAGYKSLFSFQVNSHCLIYFHGAAFFIPPQGDIPQREIMLNQRTLLFHHLHPVIA